MAVFSCKLNLIFTCKFNKCKLHSMLWQTVDWSRHDRHLAFKKAAAAETLNNTSLPTYTWKMATKYCTLEKNDSSSNITEAVTFTQKRTSVSRWSQSTDQYRPVTQHILGKVWVKWQYRWQQIVLIVTHDVALVVFPKLSFPKPGPAQSIEWLLVRRRQVGVIRW